MSITYGPKIDPVLDGRCKQTIRKGHKVAVGDEILFHGWGGRPYRSKWSWRTRVIVGIVNDIEVESNGIRFSDGMIYDWKSHFCHVIASEDYIYPATGEALKAILSGLNGSIKEPVEYQIIRW